MNDQNELNMNTIVSDAYIDKLVASREPAQIFLSSGVKLVGKIIAHDSVCINLTLDRSKSNSGASIPDDATQIVYKNNIATLSKHFG